MNSIKSLVTSFDKLYSNNEESALMDESLEEEYDEEDSKQDEELAVEEALEEDEDEEEEEERKSLGEKRDVDQSIRQVVIADDDEDIEEDDETINLLESKSSYNDQQELTPPISTTSTSTTTTTKDKSRRSFFYMIFVDWNPLVWTYLLVTFPFRYIIYLFIRKDSQSSPSKDTKGQDHEQQKPQSSSSQLIPPGIITQLPDELSSSEIAPRERQPSIDSTASNNISEAEEDMLIRDNSEDNLTTTNIIKNKNITTLKTTTIINNAKSRSSNKYWIPAPPRLYPMSRSKSNVKKKKILILDLDETLIHSLNKLWIRSSTQSKMIEIKLNNISSLYYVHKRPFCDYFLQETLQWFELQIFTASVKEYADPIIDWLESEVLDKLKKKGMDNNNNSNSNSNSTTTNTINNLNGEEPNKIFTKRYYRNDCTYRSGVGYIKDLSKFIRDDDLRNVMILDNSPISYALHEENAISIEGWINDQNDRDLLNLLPLLKSLSLAIDVRYILGLKNGEKFFE